MNTRRISRPREDSMEIPYIRKRIGETFYVSKLGDDSDGLSWRTAFHTVQAALSAIPDEQGGYTIAVRPDTYMEANLFTAHKGAPGHTTS